MNKKTVFITTSAIIAALYAALTYISAAMCLAYGEVQFRLSEALTVLPLFTPAAVPGLTIGCIVSNITSTVNIADMVIGSAASFAAAVLTRKLRNVKIKNYPFLSVLMPVLVNGIIVGAEITYFAAPGESAFVFFLSAFASVAAGEAAVCFILGSGLIAFINKNQRVKNLIEGRSYTRV